MSFRETGAGRWFLGTVEYLPILAFVYSGRMAADLSDRFFWGAGIALAVAPLLALQRWRPNPLLVAINAWLCVEALGFVVDLPLLADALGTLRESAFFLALLLVGAGYVAFSERGLLTGAHDDRRRVRGCSLALLALIAGGLVCSIVFRGNETLAATLPATVVLLAQVLMGVYLRRRSSTRTEGTAR